MNMQLAPIATNATVVKQGGPSVPLAEDTKVLATILTSNKDKPGILVRPFAREGDNASVPALAIRFRIDDGQKGAGRNLFEDVAWARNLKSTGGGKFPDGTPSYSYFGLFRSLGYDVDPVQSPENPQGLFAYPGDENIIGKQVELVLGYDAPQYHPNTGDQVQEARNTVKFINKANGIPVQTPAVIKAQAALDAAAGAAPAAGPVAASQAPAQAWTPGAVAQPAPLQQAAPPAAGWQPPQQAAPAAYQPPQQVAPAAAYQPPVQQAPQGYQPPAQVAPPAYAAPQQTWTPDPADVAAAQQLVGAVAGKDGFAPAGA